MVKKNFKKVKVKNLYDVVNFVYDYIEWEVNKILNDNYNDYVILNDDDEILFNKDEKFIYLIIKSKNKNKYLIKIDKNMFIYDEEEENIYGNLLKFINIKKI